MASVKCKSCGNKISPKNSIRYPSDGGLLHFCSEKCRNDFTEIFALDMSSTQKSSLNNWLNKGKELFKLKEYEKAHECFNSELIINPRSLEALSYNAITFFQLEMYWEAIDYFDKALEINPQDENIWLNKGVSFFVLKEYDNAFKCFQNVIKINPKNINALCYSADILLYKLKRYKEAIRYCNMVLELDPGNEKIWFYKGISLSEIQKYDDAFSCYQKVIEITPEHIDALYFSARVLSDLNVHDEAFNYCNKALKLDPVNAKVWSLKGNLFYKVNNYEQAIKCYQKSVELNPFDIFAMENCAISLFILHRFEEAILDCNKVLEIDPENEYTLLCKGSSFVFLGEYEIGIQLFEKVLTINPNGLDAQIFKAVALTLIERYEDAVDCCNSALKFDPTNEKFLTMKARILNSAKKYQEAFDFCIEILKVNSSCQDAWLQKGVAYNGLGKKEEVIPCFENALKINSENELALEYMELALFYDKKYEKAIKYADMVLELEYHQNDFSITYFIKSVSLYFLDRYEEAIYYFDKILEIDYEREKIYFLKGNCLLSLGKIQEAIDCFSKLLIINPENVEGWYKKGLSYFRKGDNEEAVKCLDKALEINPENVYLLETKAEILKQIYKFNESLICYITLADIDPDFKNKDGLTVIDCIRQLQNLVSTLKVTGDLQKNITNEIKIEFIGHINVYSSDVGNEFNRNKICILDTESINFLERKIEESVGRKLEEFAERELKEFDKKLNSLIEIVQQLINPVSEKQEIIIQNQSSLYSKVTEDHKLILENQKRIFKNAKALENDIAKLKNELKNYNPEDLISLIENKTDELSTRIQKEDKKDYETFVNIAREATVSWDKLNENTKGFLAMAEYLYSSIDELNGLEERNYSHIVLEFCKSFENELKDKLFHNFILFTCSNSDIINSFKPDPNEDAEKLFDALLKQQRGEKYRLTLGAMYTTLDCVRLEGNRNKQSELIKKFRIYLKVRFELNKIVNSKFLEIFKEICNYRNKSAHLEKLSKNHVDTVKTKVYTLIDEFVNSKK